MFPLMLQKAVAHGAKHRNHKCFLLFTDGPETIGLYLYMITSVLRERDYILFCGCRRFRKIKNVIQHQTSYSNAL